MTQNNNVFVSNYVYKYSNERSLSDDSLAEGHLTNLSLPNVGE